MAEQLRPDILRLVRALESQGKRLEAKAARAVAAQYRGMALADLVALLQVASQPLYAGARTAHVDLLMGAFRAAAQDLGKPEGKLVQILGKGVHLGSTAGARMLVAAQTQPGIVDAFRVRPDLELELAQGAADRLERYWGKEQRRLADEVEAALLEGLERGQAPDQMAARLRERVAISKRRAMLIATNEASNAMAAGQEAAQREAGVTRYRWLTAKDERVRKEHRERDGQIFSWDAPPDDGHPGQPVRCRCVALAVFED